MITERLVTDSCWPADLRLNLKKFNWDEWSIRMSLFANSRGLTEWLDGSLKRPDEAAYPGAHYIWQRTDGSLRTFMLGHISRRDYRAVSHLEESHSVFEQLRKRHENPGIHIQATLLKKFYAIQYNPNTPFSKTSHELRALSTKIFKMRIFEPDRLRCIVLYNALRGHFKHIQSTIRAISESPGFSSDTIIRLVEREDSLMRLRETQRPQLVPSTSAAVNRDRTASLVCSDFKRANHTVDFCIKPGGKMAGRSLVEARAAQRGNAGRNETVNSATSAPLANLNVATISTQHKQAPPPTVEINGVLYHAVPNAVPNAVPHRF
jgi:gag-polypeptide of LTR copia-type